MNTTEDKTYNGWTNYETWAVKLWLDNDESSQRLQHELLAEARQNLDSEVLTPAEETKYNLVDLLKTFVEENIPEFEPSMYSDLLDAAISEVNWHEIAEAIIGAENG